MAHIKPLVISINWEWAKRVGKIKFLSALSHLCKEKELSDMYDKVVPPKEVKKKTPSK